MSLMAKHQIEVAQRGLWGPVKVQTIIVKALQGQKMDFQSQARQRIESLGGRAPGAGSAGGEASVKQASWGRAWVVKPKRFNKTIPVGSRHGEHYLGCPQWLKSPEVA
jgi:hypothetical protein